MAKTGLSKSQISGMLTRIASRSGWSLCVGAGISKPAFPDWFGLVVRLGRRDGPAAETTAIPYLRSTYSPDALIQAAMDRLGLNEQAFSRVLAEDLYSTISEKLTTKEWKTFSRAMNSSHIGSITKVMWEEFLQIVNNHFPQLTGLAVAPVLAKVLGTGLSPQAILSFNAEPLFPALINANVAMTRGIKGGDLMDYVLESTSDRKAGRIPYVFCHGLLPIPGMTHHSLSSVDKLVFLEGSYLQLANTSFSWQSTSFLRLAAGTSMVFVGVSLTDPNMRRWLSWVHATRVAELTEAGSPAPASTVHYWITRKPPGDTTQRWIESLVAHLGIRLVWVQEYSEIVDTLDLMIR